VVAESVARSRYGAVLLERSAFGDGRTVCSRRSSGKYALSGSLTIASDDRGHAERWRAC
jgi:hypothetical protein